ncbi:hypothetical protein ACFYQA_22695 [Streptomyces sp. NPDC005774]|uniref:hypothetical protein n=1 Tax=Streptomyces sp. NPDC005774 TaxID=3364728 RepID=UPI0036934FE6
MTQNSDTRTPNYSRWGGCRPAAYVRKVDIEIEPGEILPGDTLLDGDGVPFAIVVKRTGRKAVKVTTTALDGVTPFFPVHFPAGTTAMVRR